jgi:hypothetical protein
MAGAKSPGNGKQRPRSTRVCAGIEGTIAKGYEAHAAADPLHGAPAGPSDHADGRGAERARLGEFLGLRATRSTRSRAADGGWRRSITR